MKDCIFCEIIDGKRACLKIYEDEWTLVIMDRAMDMDGHLLVIPKKHVVNILDCDEQTLDKLMKTVKKMANYLVDYCHYDGVNLLNASKKAAEQSISHFHIHIIPRKNNDGISSWPNFLGAKKAMLDVYHSLQTNRQEIHTDRLLLRPFCLEDTNDLLNDWISDPNIQHEYGEPVYTTEDEVRQLLASWISNYQNPNYYRYAIVEKMSKRCIGQIAFCRVYPEINTAEIEYCISSSYWGNGYAFEALENLINYVFEYTSFQKLEAYHRKENMKSGRVLEKSRMKVVDTVERFIREQKGASGEVCYAIRKGEFFSN